MKLPGLIRCASSIDGDRCDLPRFHGHRHIMREGNATHSWGTETTRRQTYETTAPWVTWTWLSTDRETRFTGRMRMKLTCCICGEHEIVRPRIPRFGPVPEPVGGVHPERLAAIERHSHPDRRDPSDWVLPLRNMAAWQGGVPLSVFENVARAAQMEAEMDDPPQNQEGR